MAHILLLSAILLATIPGFIAPPVVEKQPKPVEDTNTGEDTDTGLEYDRYLKEVVSILEEDEGFRKKLEESNITYIKSGEIAQHLEMVSHRIRTRLDELKRRELTRLKELMHAKMQAAKAGDSPDHLPDFRQMVKHIGHHGEQFEVKDLEKLIVQATNDLEEADKKRRENFKEYEMEKEHLRREKLKRMTEEERKKEEEHEKELEQKHKEHPKVHEPGSKDQLEEVWEKTDHMDPDDFDPKTFFKMHDLDGDGFWDEEETEALFQKELDKVYDPENPEEDDMVEREEDMARMREHLDNDVDTDKDRLISFDEFIKYTKSDDFDKDDGWLEGVDDTDNFTDEEFDEFVKKYEQKLKDHNINKDDLKAAVNDLNIKVRDAAKGPDGPMTAEEIDANIKEKVISLKTGNQPPPVPVDHLQPEQGGQQVDHMQIQQQQQQQQQQQ
ncbi:unnamed protein product, partial [Owenia fusiformis]